MKLLLQTFVRTQHYSLLCRPKEMEVVAKDPGKCASLMQGGRAQEDEIPLRPGTFICTKERSDTYRTQWNREVN